MDNKSKNDVLKDTKIAIIITAAIVVIIILMAITGYIAHWQGEQIDLDSYTTDDRGMMYVPSEDVRNNPEIFGEIIDPDTGDYLAEADGFHVGDIYIDFEGLRKYDWICDAMEEMNENATLDIETTVCLFNPYGNAAEDFSAEIEEQLRRQDADAERTVIVPFLVEDIPDAVVFTLKFDEHKLLNAMTIALAGNENFTENGISLTFSDYGLNVINNGKTYTFGWTEE